MTDGTWMVNIKSSHDGESAMDTTPFTIEKSLSERNQEAQEAAAEANAKFQEMLPKMDIEYWKRQDELMEEIRRRSR